MYGQFNKKLKGHYTRGDILDFGRYRGHIPPNGLSFGYSCSLATNIKRRFYSPSWSFMLFYIMEDAKAEMRALQGRARGDVKKNC